MFTPDYNYYYYYYYFKHTESTNGKDIMMLARELERKTAALARYKKHLTFNHTLKRENILPPRLMYTPPIRSKAGYKIARKTSLKLRLRITQCHQNINNLQTKIQELKQKLEDHLPCEDMLALQTVVRHTSETISEQLANTHARKIDDLISKVTRQSTVVDKEKWVVNISKRDIPWVPEDIFFLSILMVRGEAGLTRKKITSGHRSTQPHFHVRNQFRI